MANNYSRSSSSSISSSSNNRRPKTSGSKSLLNDVPSAPTPSLRPHTTGTPPLRSFITSTNSFNSRVHPNNSLNVNFPSRYFSVIEHSAKERYLRKNSHLFIKHRLTKQGPQEVSQNTLAIQNSPAREIIQEIPEAEIAAYQEVLVEKGLAIYRSKIRLKSIIVLLVKAFKFFDRDGNGSIDNEELRIALSAMQQNATEDELDLMIRNIDFNNTGQVDFDEFLAVMATSRPLKERATVKTADTFSIFGNLSSAEDEKMVEAFRAMDIDGNGFISPADLRHVFDGLGEHVSEERILEMIRDLDTVGNGQVSFHDFSKMMTNQI